MTEAAFGADGPAAVAIAFFEGFGDGEVVLLEVGFGVFERLGDAGAAFAFRVGGVGGDDEFAEDKIAIRGGAGAVVGQAVIREHFEFDAGDALKIGFAEEEVVSGAFFAFGQGGGEEAAIGQDFELFDATGALDLEVERMPFGGEIEVVFPLRLIRGRGVKSGLHLGFGGFDGGEACGFLFGDFRGHFGFVGREFGLSGLDGQNAIGLSFGDGGLLLDFLGLSGGGERFVLGIESGHAFERGADFLLGGVTVHDAHEDGVDELFVVFDLIRELGDGVGGIADGIADGRSAHQSHHGAEIDVVAAFALADGFASRAAEVGEEAVLQFDLRIGQSGGAGAFGHAGDVWHAAGDGEDAVKEHLGGQAAGFGVAVVRFVVLVPFVGAEAEIVGAAGGDEFHQVTHVEAALDEFVREVLQQLGIARRIAGADVVERLDDAGAGEVAPDAVGVAHGEVVVLRAGHPGGKLVAASRGGLADEFGVIRHFRCDGFVRAEVEHIAVFFVGDDFIQRLRAFDGGAADGGSFGLRIAFEVDLGKVGRGFVILIHRPLLEGMVVALVAVESRGQKEVRGVLDEFLRCAHRFEVSGGGIVFV